MKTYIGKYDAKIYPREALLKASYQFINDYYVHLKMDGDSYAVEFAPKEEAEAMDSSVAEKFENELLAAAVRLNVYQQTHVLREVMLGRAMASTMILDEDEEDVPPNESEADNSLTDILKDWFDHD